MISSPDPSIRHCPDCGNTVPPGLGLLLCPVCGLTPSQDGEDEEDTDESDLARAGVTGMKFGRYTLLDEIGRGGMGIVYRARQDRLGRIVALKVLPGSAILTEDWRRRFDQEAASAAQLHHPHVVQIIESGEHLGQLFIAMEWVDGHNLAQRLRDGPLEPTIAAQLLSQVAEAVAHAHAQGVVHRDVKPGNIIISPESGAVLVDFGLARPAKGAEALTQTVMGSPNYMPPERLAGQTGDAAEARAGDVYGLGAVLYHCLTGLPPHSGETLAAVLATLAAHEPVPPRLLRRQLPRDLETICLKCLERRPAARYDSALTVKEELQRFLRNEPTLARPLHRAARFARWCSRHVALSMVSAALLLAVAVGSAASLLGWRNARRQTTLTLAANDLLRRQAYASDLAAAGAALANGSLPLATQLLQRHIPSAPDQPDLRGFEWYYLRDQLRPGYTASVPGHAHIVKGMAWHPGGQRLLTAAHDGSLRDWTWDDSAHALTARPHPPQPGVKLDALAFLPDGSGYLLAGEKGITCRQAEDHTPLWTLPGQNLALSADGHWLAVSSTGPDYYDPPGKITLYQLTGSAPPAFVREMPGQRRLAALAPDGRWLATSMASPESDNSDRTLEVHDLHAPAEQPLTLPVPAQASRMAFSPAGDVLAVTTRNGQKGILRFSLPAGTPLPLLLPDTPNIWALHYLADPPLLLAGSSDRSITSVDPASQTIRQLGHAHENEIWALALHPGGHWLASGDKDGTLRIHPFPLEPKSCQSIASIAYDLPIFSPDSTALYTRINKTPSNDSQLCRHLLGPASTIETLPGGRLVGTTPAGERLLWNGTTSALEMWTGTKPDRSISAALPPPDKRGGQIKSTVTRDGRYVGLLFYHGCACRFDLHTGQTLVIDSTFPKDSNGIALSGDGRYFIVVDWTSMFIHDCTTHQTTLRDNSRHWCKALEFSPDSSLLAVPGMSAKIEILRVPDWTLLTTLRGHLEEATFARFTPDGRTLISAEKGDGLRLWSTDQWRELLHIPVPKIYQFQIAPDGQSLAAEILPENDRNTHTRLEILTAPR
jgi:eukaryotic-like serine/threonine-protein kinase